MQDHGVFFNFPDGYDNYYRAYKYVTKEDPEVYLSPGHPNLAAIGSPRTSAHITRPAESANPALQPVTTMNEQKYRKMLNV